MTEVWFYNGHKSLSSISWFGKFRHASFSAAFTARKSLFQDEVECWKTTQLALHFFAEWQQGGFFG
jgi:hypothetical protein